MAESAADAHHCAVCGKTAAKKNLVPGALLRPAMEKFIAARVPGWTNDSRLCADCLNRLRTEFVEAELEADRGALTSLEQEVVDSLHERELLAENLNKEYDAQLSVGDRLADRIAAFGGSWAFILLFAGILLVWVTVNSIALLTHPFDPYPYILLNLFLSMLAAIQAPIIMMSQNRQEDRDRLRAENDYQVNLKAEIEIRAMGEKLDQLLHTQWQHLLEIQRIQTEMLDELARKKGH
jgi:uncharacterized membrane protein